MRRNTSSRERPGHPGTGLLAGVGAALALSLAAPTAAQTAGSNYDPDRTYVYSNAGVVLPTPTPTYGQDEVQGAGGVACRSSVSGGGPYLDAGFVGTQDPYRRDTTAAYARVVVPLGRRPQRIDCSALYQLEIERLRLELELARMNLGAAARPATRFEPSTSPETTLVFKPDTPAAGPQLASAIAPAGPTPRP